MYKIKYRSSEEMKDSGIDWIRIIPNNWEIKRNKNLFYKSKKIVGKKAINYSVLSLTLNGVIYRDVDSNMGKMPKEWGQYQLVSDDDLLMCLFDMDVTPRTVGYVDKVGIVSPAYSKYKKFDSNIHMKFFYYWYLNLDMRKMLLHLSKNLRNSISSTEFDRLNILVPPKNQQHKIANFLDIKTSEFDSIISKKEKLIEKLEEAKKSLISEAVTGKVKIIDGQIAKRQPEEMKDSGVEWLGRIPNDWKVKKIKYISQCYPSNVDKKTKSGEKTVKLCNYTDVYYNDYITKSLDFMIATANKAQVKKFGLNKGDIILTKDSESPDDIAIASYVEEDIDNLVCGYHLTLIKPFKQWNSLYIYFQLLTTGVKNYFETVANGVTRFGIGIDGFKNLSLCVPPKDEQDKISKFLKEKLDNTNIIENRVHKQILKLKQAKQSLISEAVTGKIDLRDWEIIEQGEEQ